MRQGDREGQGGHGTKGRPGQRRGELVLTITLFGLAPRVSSRRINSAWLNNARPPGEAASNPLPAEFSARRKQGRSLEGCERREILLELESVEAVYLGLGVFLRHANRKVKEGSQGSQAPREGLLWVLASLQERPTRGREGKNNGNKRKWVLVISF